MRKELSDSKMSLQKLIKQWFDGIKSWFAEYPIMLVNLVILIIGSFFVPSLFTRTNLVNLAEQSASIGIAAVGLTIVIIAGGVDLSITANMALAAVIGAKVMNMGSSPSALLGVAVIVLVALIISSLNAIYIVGVGMHHFITTISMSILLEGIALWVTESATVANLPWNFLAISRLIVFGWPFPVILAIIVFIVANYFLTRTAFGRSLYAIGGNREAAWISGINVSKIRVVSYLISGLCAALAGILITGRLGGASPTAGRYILLDVVSASVLGGASLFGGKGNMIGALSGVILIGLITNIMNLLGVLFYFTLVLKGAILILAMIFDYYQRNRVIAARRPTT